MLDLGSWLGVVWHPVCLTSDRHPKRSPEGDDACPGLVFAWRVAGLCVIYGRDASGKLPAGGPRCREEPSRAAYPPGIYFARRALGHRVIPVLDQAPGDSPHCTQVLRGIADRWVPAGPLSREKRRSL